MQFSHEVVDTPFVSRKRKHNKNKQCSSDTLQSERDTSPFLSASTGPLHFKFHEASRHSSCMMPAIRQTGNGPRPCSGQVRDLCAVKRKPIGRLIILITQTTACSQFEHAQRADGPAEPRNPTQLSNTRSRPMDPSRSGKIQHR